jgi:flagellum-specific ATP synthase
VRVSALLRGHRVGGVRRVVGTEVECAGLRLAVGDAVDLDPRRAPGRRGHRRHDGAASALVLGTTTGIARGDRVRPAPARSPRRSAPRCSAASSTRSVVPSTAGPIGPLRGGRRAAPPALARQRIDRPLATGVRLLDTLCTVGRGQRLGLFAGSGVGKSTLLSMMVRGTDADVSVIALVGERGREVREFVEDVLGPEGLARSVVVVATSDEPALLRLRAATYATRSPRGSPTPARTCC